MTFSSNLYSFVLMLVILVCAARTRAQQPGSLGAFDRDSEVGENPRHGTATYDPAKGEYRVIGGGANMWAQVDAFHFLWKRVTGNFSITANVQFVGKGVEDHRKAVLMIRQSLEPNSAYADVALHGDGLTSLQFRPAAGAATSEVRSAVSGPIRVRIERRGAQFYMYAGKLGEPMVPSIPATVGLEGPVYIGLGVCSHNANVLETALFTDVEIKELPATEPNLNPTRVRSKISVYDLESKSVRVVYQDDKLWEAPNWSGDGKYLLANSGGAIYKFTLNAAGATEPERIALDSSYDCNNDKGLSPDGKRLAFSAEHSRANGSQVFVAEADGTNPRLLTTNVPSYFHGWSPDGEWLAFVAERNKNFDIYRISSNGGDEQRLTSSPGFDDGPDYSADGKWIYINSNRSGGWDIWRFPADGAGTDDAKSERVTADAEEDWFPHPSPDRRWLVFLSFPPGTKNHDAKTAVKFRMMRMPDSNAPARPPDEEEDEEAIQVLTQVFGGQGTINVNSWAPDSKKFAFVSYEVLP